MADKFISHRKVAARNDLTACAGFNVDNDWCLQVEGERFGMPGDNHQKLSVAEVPHCQRTQLTAGDPHLIVGHESPGADNRQSDIAAAGGLQPSQGIIACIGELRPSLAVFQAGQPAGEMQQVVRFNVDASEPRCVDAHGWHSFAGFSSPFRLESFPQ